LKTLLEYHTARIKEDPRYTWQVPAAFVEAVRLGREYGNSFSPELPRMLFHFREDPHARSAALILMDMKAEEIQKMRGLKLFSEAFLCDYSWLLSWQEYCETAGQELGTGHKYGNLKTFICRLEQTEDHPEEWFDELLAMLNDTGCLPEVTFAGEKEKLELLYCRALQLTLRKGTKEQVRKMLSLFQRGAFVFTENRLVRGGSRFLFEDPVKLYRMLKNVQWGQHAVFRVLATQEWKRLPFEELCEIAVCMLKDEGFFKTWLNAMLEELDVPGYSEIVQAIMENCPELDLTGEKAE
jgi:hypothetical protein